MFAHVLSGFVLISYHGRESELVLLFPIFPLHPFTLSILPLLCSQLSLYLENALPTRLKYTVESNELKGKREQAKLDCSLLVMDLKQKSCFVLAVNKVQPILLGLYLQF